MATLTPQTFVPQGFTAGRNPMISEAVVRRFDRLGKRVPPQRLLLVKSAGAKNDAVEAFLGGHARWMPRPKAPGAWEVDMTPEDVAVVTARKDLFKWVDLGTRLFGKPVEGGATTIAVRCAPKGGEVSKCEADLREAGGTGTTKTGGVVEGKIAATKLTELLRADWIEAVEVIG